MAVPRDLPIRPLISDQSLQTPDTSALFLPSSSSSPAPVSSSATSVGFTSLEELLDASGINNLDGISLTSCAVQQSRKRTHSDSVEVGNGCAIKSPRLENSASPLTSATGSMSQLENSILSQVTSSKVTTIPSIMASVNRGQHLLPTRLPLSGNSSSLATTLAQTSGLDSLQQHPVFVNSTGERRPGPSPSNDPVVTGSLPLLGSGMASLFSQPSAASAVAVLVQQFKQAQAGGDMLAMDSIRHKLLLLHQQLATRAVSSGLAQTSFPSSVSAAATTIAASSKPGLVSTGPISNRSKLLSLSTSPATSTQPLTPNTTSTFLSAANSVRHGLLPAIPISTTAPSAMTTNLPSSQAKPFPSTFLPNTTSSTPSTVNPIEGIHRTPLHCPTSCSNALPHFSSTRNPDGSKLPDLPAVPIPQISSLMSSIPANNLVSPSIVTQLTTPSMNSSPIRPQGAGLHVTAQTQANVLRAVYGYRLRQIQDFLSTLPADQRPSSTQELREMLKQNNVLSKGLPPAFLAQLQHQDKALSLAPPSTTTPTESVPATLSAVTGTTKLNSVSAPVLTQSKQGLPHNLSTPTPALLQLPPSNPLSTSSSQSKTAPSLNSLSSTIATQSSISARPVASSTSSSSVPSSVQSTASPSQPPVVLPGVTMETLRTLCRLPEADVSRIPMHPMLQAVVRFLRTAKWVGNKTELPHLLQKAQEAIGKSTLIQSLPQLPPQPVTTEIQTVGSVLQQLSSTSSSSSSLTSTSASPLAQYMAKVGARMPANDSGLQKDHPCAPSSGTSLPQQTTSRSAGLRPLTRYQHRIQQEKVEQERLQALQKALQSSEEARIAFRFQAHMEKLHQQLLSPEILRPFSSWHEVALRLIPYHVYSEPELPQGAMEKAEAVYEGIAGVLQSKAQGMMSRFQQILDQENKSDRVMTLVIDKLWIEGEKERKEEEERQRLEAEQVAQELSAMSDPLSDQLSIMSPESDPLLSNYWTSHNNSDFFSGIT